MACSNLRLSGSGERNKTDKAAYAWYISTASGVKRTLQERIGKKPNVNGREVTTRDLRGRVARGEHKKNGQAQRGTSKGRRI